MDNYECNDKSSFRSCDKFKPFVVKETNCINPSSPTDSTIIAFSTGISISHIQSVVGLASSLGFGTANTVSIINNTINLKGTTSEAFTVPCEGNITAIAASFSPLSSAPLVEGSVTIRAQIFLAPAGSNIFTGTSAFIDLTPALTLPVITLGQIVSASSNIPPLSISVGDNLLMVFYIPSTTIHLPVNILGRASAGINIVTK
jgi:BclB C-terminal domain-containing protein